MFGICQFHTYVTVVIDILTMRPEACPVTDKEILTITKVLVQLWVSRFITSLLIHSNRGIDLPQPYAKTLINIFVLSPALL